jgi:uncharacterized protein YggE
MKTSLSPMLNPTVPALLLSLFVISIEASAQDAPARDRVDSRRTLTVTGTGEVNAAPDQAFVRLGAIAQAAEAAAAQTTVNEVMQKALSQIEKAGIPPRSIRTSGLTLTPIYASQKSATAGEPKIVGYRAGNVIEATVDDIKLVGKVIDAGLTAGANRLEGVSFGLKNDLPQRTDALTKAVEEAQTKARTMARALDVSLGAVREVNEGGVQIFRQDHFADNRSRMMVADAMQTPVEPGEIRVQATVTIHYDLGVAR